MRLGDLTGARELLQTAGESGMAGERGAIVRAAQARVALESGDLVQARAFAAEAHRMLDALPGDAASRGHGDAMVDGMAAMLDLAAGDAAAAAQCLQRAYAAGVTTGDMPIVAAIGVGIARAHDAAGDATAAAEVLGASARLRGAEDLTALEIARLRDALRAALGDDAFAAAYERGRALDREGAIARLDPSVL
jgi:hypothetical protein